MDCPSSSPLLYRLQDGRFQIIEPGKLAPIMIGQGYFLAESAFADYLTSLNLPSLRICSAVLHDPHEGQDITGYRELQITQHFSPDWYPDIDLDGERFLLMDSRYVFVSPDLKDRLENSVFHYLRFSKGLDRFAAQHPAP